MLSSLRASSKIKTALIISTIILIGLYVFSIPTFGAGSLFNKSNYILYIVMALLGVLTIFTTLVYSTFKVRWVILLVPIFAIYALLGTLIYSHEYRSWLTLLLMAIALFILFYAFRFVSNKNVILLTIISGFTIFALTYIFVLRKDIFNLSNWGRMGAPFEHPNTLSGYMVVASSITLYLLFFLDKKIKYVLLVPLALFLLVGLTNGSRTFIILFILLLVVLAVFRFRKNKWVLLGILGGIVLLLVILLSLPMLETLRFRLFNSFATIFGTSSTPDTSTLQRLSWFNYGFSLGGNKFITGYGVDGFSIYSGTYTYTHSNLSEVVCDFGVIGAVIFYLPLGVLLYQNIKKFDKHSPLVITFIIYYLVVSFANVFYYNKVYYIVLALLFFITYSDQANIDEKEIIK